jgi:hypothetical protein
MRQDRERLSRRPDSVAAQSDDDGASSRPLERFEHAMSSYLVRVNEAAAITGLPASLIRKSFMTEDKRQANIPPPPPHKKIGRAVYILRDKLEAWVESIDRPNTIAPGRRRRGRPTVVERIELRRQREASLIDSDQGT